MALKIKFVSDYVCPYCLAAKAPFLEAVKGKDVEVEWLPYELTEEPAERVDTYHDPVRKEKWAKSLAPIVKELGIDMKLPPKVIPRPYTRLAFEGYHFAKEQGKGDEYNDRLYRAYFTEELDIGDIDVLAGLAAEVGLNAADYRAALEEGKYTQIQKMAVRRAKEELDVHSVPTIFIGSTRINGGIYDKAEFERVISEEIMKAAEDQESGNGEVRDEAGNVITGMSCGIHGCDLPK